MATLNLATTPLRPDAAPAVDPVLGMAWWNHMTEQQRAEALRAAGTAVPAEAWEHWHRHQMLADAPAQLKAASIKQGVTYA